MRTASGGSIPLGGLGERTNMPGSDVSHLMNGEGGEAKEFDLLHWVQLLWDHRWWIIGVTGAVVLLAALYSFLATPIYSATATVFVQSPRPQPIGNFSYNDNSWMEDMKFYSSQPEIIKSTAVMQEVVDKLHLQDNPAFRGSAHPDRVLQSMVTVSNVKDSALFSITVTGPYKDEVATWANAVAEVYAERTLRDALNYIAKANDVMLGEARRMQEEYIKEQTAVTSNLEANRSYFPQNQKDILDKQIASLNDELTTIGVKESEVGAVVNQMQAWKRNGGDPLSLPAVAQDPSVQDLAKQYNEMSRELSRLLAKFTPLHPDVIKKREEMKALKERIATQADIVLGNYQNQLSALEAQRASLMHDLDGIRRQGLQFVEGASRSETLSTSAAAIKKYMDMLYDKMRELNVSSSLLNANIRLVDSALPPSAPVRPNKQKIMILGFLLGLMLSVGSVVGYQYLDTTVKSVEDIENRLGLNLLTMIPTLNQETQRAGMEAFQTLRTALIYASQNQQNNVILITSASPKEGKTSVIVNLAKTLAATGDRVLVVDCDLRRPALTRTLMAGSASGSPKGLTNYLASRESRIEEFIQNGPHPNLFFIGSGPIPPNPPELFSMKRFQALIQQFRKEYGWVLLDSPPCLSITDAQILAGMSDLVVLVARYGRTHRPLLERSLVSLRRLEAKVAGVVLNAVETRSSYYYDYYYYHHYYYSTGTEPKRLSWIFGGKLFGKGSRKEHRRAAGSD